jgi:hypothetical protein
VDPIQDNRVANGGKCDKSRLLHAVRHISKGSQGTPRQEREKRAGELATIDHVGARRRAERRTYFSSKTAGPEWMTWKKGVRGLDKGRAKDDKF